MADQCPSCGTGLLVDARFCHACGSPRQAVNTHAEYKQVTVLFSDVVHSMAIASAVDVERLREIMTDLYQRSASGDGAGFRDCMARYHAAAHALGFDGHIAIAESMLAGV